jgi:hypothetical protein
MLRLLKSLWHSVKLTTAGCGLLLAYILAFYGGWTLYKGNTHVALLSIFLAIVFNIGSRDLIQQMKKEYSDSVSVRDHAGSDDTQQ